ncbi:hypothetical protein COUCH_05545 [Couchioplanes caeruleus]|uniref:hypothetical protein n=1 Tax=Couchioplanes caeruleus TaxID=56438 RepID=UPI0020BF77C2|nr:hypothetical protein [Couchioplanes caeruleus]UQU65783.1 hypothetical protein COUCH_05545 [Couchioplanes caeruleus]
MRFIRFVEASGDIAAGTSPGKVTGDLSLSSNSWSFAGRAFEVSSFHDSTHDGWRYELYETSPAGTATEYVYVQIPDLQPAGGPFVPAGAGQVALASHGDSVVPWPVFRQFLDAISASGDIVDDPA